MASKKKPKKGTKRKRKSKSHVQGHVTRKLNRQEAVLLNAFKKGDKVALRKLLGLEDEQAILKRAMKVPEWLRRMPPELAKQYADYAEKVRREGWLPAQDPEYTYSGKRGKPGQKYERGAIALVYSRARHLGRITDEALRMMREAYKKGNKNEDSAAFKNMVQKLSQALDLPIKEIYTLWFSP